MPTKNEPQNYDDKSYIQSFLPTPPMSTYLSAWVICDFEYKELTSKSGIPLRVYVTKTQMVEGQADFALDILKKTFDYYELELFKIDFPLPKMDMIAIPDFVTGAMENWGLITFRESILLYVDGKSTASDQEAVANTVSHELTHMWFGNLVTMDWWDNLWLNEGFATYFAPIGVNYALDLGERADWDMLNNVVDSDIFYTMEVDDVISSHPIINSVTNADEITSIFDDITYGKGCSVIWSMVKVMGFDNFFNGLTQYLKDNQYSTVTEVDLFNALEKTADPSLDFDSFRTGFTQYLETGGYPVLNYFDNGTVVQKRFFANQESISDQTWTVSINDNTWLDSNANSVVVSNTEDTPLNLEVRSFLRVKYGENRWNAIISELNTDFERFDEVTRTQIVDDALSNAQAGEIDYKKALRVLEYLKNERSYYSSFKS